MSAKTTSRSVSTSIYQNWRKIFWISSMTLGIFLSGQPFASLVHADQYPSIVLSWIGTWDCNLDGRQAVIKFWREQIPDSCEVINGERVCRKVFGSKFIGSISDSGKAWKPLETRNFNNNDPPASVKDHLLPLRYNKQDDWLLMIHTWDRNFASGYTTWHGRAYGIQCHKRI